MKKGISIWAFPDGTTPKDAVRIAKDAGYGGIEYSIGTDGALTLDTTDKQVLAVKAVTADAGMEISSVASLLAWDYPLTSHDQAKRQRGKDIIRRQLEMAALLGADTILVVPGYVRVLFIQDSEICDYELAYERALEGVCEVTRYAEQCGVNIGLENCWNAFLLSPIEFRGFIDKVGSEMIGIYLDVGNVMATGIPEQWVRIMNKRIKKVHVKDYRLSAGGLHGFVDLLTGDINYPAVINALTETGYDDYCVYENVPAYIYHPEQAIYSTSKAMDRLFMSKEESLC